MQVGNGPWPSGTNASSVKLTLPTLANSMSVRRAGLPGSCVLPMGDAAIVVRTKSTQGNERYMTSTPDEKAIRFSDNILRDFRCGFSSIRSVQHNWFDDRRLPTVALHYM